MDYALKLFNNNEIVKENEVVFSSQLLTRFINYTDVNEKTLQNYTTDLKPFFNYLYENNIKLATGTKQQYFRACKHLFKWLASENLYPNVADNIKGFKLDITLTKKESLNEQDIQNILNNIDKTTIQGKRDYAIILLMLTGGLRINEIVNIDIQDIQVIKGEYVVYILGKGHTEKDQYIKIIKPVYDVIQDYLSTRKNIKKTDALFTGTSNRALNQKITKESLSQIIKTRFRNSGYDTPKITAHSLRHTSNTLLYKSGADLYEVQLHARHKDPKTTEIYIHQADRENNTSEMDIYNQIFNSDNQNVLNDIRQTLNKLNENELKDVLNYINKNILIKEEV